MKKIILYKYGKREHLYNLFCNGRLYLTPASSYADDSHSKGAYDEGELVLKQKLPPDAKFSVVSKNGENKGTIKPIHVGPVVSGPVPDALLFCLSSVYDKSLYKEFDADTCLIIEDADRFINQACKAIQQELVDWAIDAGSVIYRDEGSFFNLGLTNQDIYYNKLDRYQNQKEVRIVCTNSTIPGPFKHKIVNIGNLLGYTQITGIEYPDGMIPTEEYLNACATPFPLKEGD